MSNDPADDPSLPFPSARRSVLWRTLLLYVAVAVLSLGTAGWAMQLWGADLRVPFTYEKDALLTTMLVKTIVDTGWYFQNTDLGVPAGMMLYDYPVGDNLMCAAFRFMALFTSDPVLILNLFYLFSFPLIALTAFFACRRIGVSAGTALLVSFLYTLLPFHFWRGTSHIFFSAYFLVPLEILVVRWISSGLLLARRWRVWFSLGIGVLMGCSVPYYPFFTCFLLVVAAGLALARRRDIAHALAAGALIGVVVVVMLINLSPDLLYMRTHGRSASGKRYSFESEQAGMKIVQLLLPVTGHRIPAFASLKAEYNSTHPIVNENDWASLGFTGGAGFLALIGWVLFVRRRWPEIAPGSVAIDPADEKSAPALVAARWPRFGVLLDHLSVFNVAAVLLATIGGFSSLFATLVSPQIRGFNRISPFIAFFSLLTVAIGLEWVARRWVHTRRAGLGYAAALVLLGLLGLLDQTGADARHDWTGLASAFHNDQQYFSRVQKTLPAGSMIFQLPYEPFPEYGLMINQMSEYALFRPYLHTHGLRWSYGAIKTRPGDLWEIATAKQPPAEMLKTVMRAGFAGIYIDRFGYEDRAAALESALRKSLGTGPLTDAQGRFALFKLPKPTSPPPPLEDLLPLPPPVWGVGFYNLEASPDQKTEYRWCGPDGEASFLNDTQGKRRVRLQAFLSSSGPTSSTLQIRSAALNTDVMLDATGTAFSRIIELPPGNTAVHFHCDAKPAPAMPGDTRALVWRMDNFLADNAANPVPSDAVQPPSPPVWASGFYSLEKSDDQKTEYRWCAPDGELRLRNDTQDTRRVNLQATLRVGTVASTTLQIRSPALNDDVLIEATGTGFSRTIDLPPGGAVIHFHCDAKPIPTGPGDSRSLVWRVENFKLQDAASLPPPASLPLAPPVWIKGFYDPDQSADQKTTIHWCGAEGEMRFWNDAPTPRRVNLRATLRVGSVASTTLQIRSPALNDDVLIEATGTGFSRTIDLPPGATVIHFHCDATPMPTAPGDTRSLVWRVENFKLQDAASLPPPASLPLAPPALIKGFYSPEQSADQKTTIHWCGTDGEMRFWNDAQTPRRTQLEAILRVGAVPSATLQIRSPVLSEDLVITPAGTAFSRTVDLPPGASMIRFHCDATALPARAGDPRSLVWRVDDLKVGDPVTAPSPAPSPAVSPSPAPPPVASPTVQPSPSPSPSPVASPVVLPTPSPSPSPTIPPAPSPVPKPTAQPSPSPAPSPAAPAAVQTPLPSPTWTGGFYDAEKSPDQKTTFRWCAPDGELHLQNDAQTTRRVHLEAILRPAAAAPAALQVRSPMLNEDLVIAATGRTFARTVDLPPGATVIRFHCDAKPLPATTGDSRTLVWRVENFKLENAANAPLPAANEHLPTPVWANGFYTAEKSPDQKTTLHWCGPDGEVRFQNDTQMLCHVHLEAILRPAGAASVKLQIDSTALKEEVTLAPEGTIFSRAIDLPPGDTVMHFHCDGKPVPGNPGDTRTLVWRVDNFALEETRSGGK